MPQDYGKDSYTTIAAVATYLDRSLTDNEAAILGYIIPAVSRWIDKSLGTNFDKLSTIIPFGSDGSGWTQLKFAGGYNEINIRPCQQITLVQAVNPYDFSVWYTYSTPLEYIAEPYNYSVKRSLRIKLNEFTGSDPTTGMKWPGDLESMMVTALFTEYDYDNDCYPSDIVLLCNHVCAIWLQNNQNAEPFQREQVEGHLILKRVDDMMLTDPVITRVIQSREEIWLEDM
jgi:hypothetical protein